MRKKLIELAIIKSEGSKKLIHVFIDQVRKVWKPSLFVINCVTMKCCLRIELCYLSNVMLYTTLLLGVGWTYLNRKVSLPVYWFVLVDCKTSNFAFVKIVQICSWNHFFPVPSNKGKVSCSRKQREPFMGLNSRLTDNYLSTYMTYHCLPPLFEYLHDLYLPSSTIWVPTWPITAFLHYLNTYMTYNCLPPLFEYLHDL